MSKEKLVGVAIKQGDQVHAHDSRTHYELREVLECHGFEPSLNDVEGFVTSTGRFVNRYEAAEVAYQSKQIIHRTGRPLLSSDVKWS